MPRANTKKQKKQPNKSLPGAAPVKKAFIKKALYAAVFVLIAAGFLAFFRNSPYFKITDVRVIDTENAAGIERDALLKTYTGRNIFDVDITSLSFRLKSDYPFIRDAVVKRVMPNSLEVDIVPRVPVAKLKSDRYFPLDGTGMVLYPGTKSENLPVIMGLSFWLRPEAGKRLDSNRINSALHLVEALDKSGVSREYNVTAIDAANFRNLSFHLENGIEIKIGDGEYAERLKRLKKTLAKPGLDTENIKYIDLRFKDVVIGPK